MKSIKQILRKTLSKEIKYKAYKVSKRSLFLADVAEDLQAGILVESVDKRGIHDELVDIGIRIPSIENILEQYEIDRMRDMGYSALEPMGWLTMWRGTHSLNELNKLGLGVDSIQREYDELILMIDRDVGNFDRDVRRCLEDCELPVWAEMPESNPLIIRSLASCSSNCEKIDKFFHNFPNAAAYKDDFTAFCKWLRNKGH